MLKLYNLFLFESVSTVDYLRDFFLKLKSNYIEKVNIETKKLSRKGLIPWSQIRLSAVWYDVVYDIQSLNMAVCFEILIFLGDLCLVKFFSFIATKSHTDHVFLVSKSTS